MGGKDGFYRYFFNPGFVNSKLSQSDGCARCTGPAQAQVCIFLCSDTNTSGHDSY